MYRARIDSFSELPKDKRPPRDLWDKPWRLGEFLDTLWDTGGPQKSSPNMYEYDESEVE